ncbi:hypothetical protein KSP39_PZI013437 [Platanthera zijinensis]|uniref:Pectinesterase inhibitor domain-containing protein n=1 Tax=Platanthera zijinensis TaxID=2320716 RepID=A0AAP0BCT2_9ASPA
MTKLILICCLITALVIRINGHRSSIFAAAPAPSAPAAGDIVADTCKRAAAGDPDLDYNFCKSLLQSAPGSHKADLRGLAVISINLAKNNAQRVLGHIRNLIGEETNNTYRKECLKTCKEVYADAVGELKDSAKSIDSGRIHDARTALSASFDAAGTCEDSFSDGNIPSPLAADDDYYQNIGRIALSLAALLDN